jgi:hypothetical protein
MFKYPLIFLLLVNIAFHASAQRGRISLSSSYNMPLGQMKWSYQSAPDLNLSGWWGFDESRRWTTGVGMGVGYLQFNPIADTLYYIADRGGVGGVGLGKAVYSPFKILKVSGSLMAIRKFNKKLGTEFSLDVAYYYGKRDISFTDEFGAQDGISELGTRGALVPKIGLSYNLNDRWNVTPFVSYSFMIEVGDTNPAAMNYNPDTGKWMHFYSAGLALNYLL